MNKYQRIGVADCLTISRWSSLQEVVDYRGPSQMKAQPQSKLRSLTLDYRSELIGKSYILHADAFEWLSRIPENSLHAIVTDPPYGVKEYNLDQIEKRENGNGGIWRIPPSFDGHTRAPLPRFNALNPKER